jgi:hypothetical protein
MDLHSDYNHRWHSPKVKSYNSPIEGLGVIAVEHIKKGEVVFVYGGVIVPRAELEDYHKKLGDVGIQIDDNFWICPTSREELEKQGVINHSCDPNVGYSNQVVLTAIRDIKPNEEITFDYAFSESFMDELQCNCGSPQCRKKITQDDWKLKNLQDKYAEYFSPYLKNKISFFNSRQS